MSAAKHAPGPCPHVAWSAQGDGITLCCVSCGVPHPLSSAAGTKLITAAPALADVAELVLRHATIAMPGELIDAATAALRAAGRFP